MSHAFDSVLDGDPEAESPSVVAVGDGVALEVGPGVKVAEGVGLLEPDVPDPAEEPVEEPLPPAEPEPLPPLVGAAATTSVTLDWVEPAELVPVTTNVYVPGVEGTPERAPVVGLRLNPAGTEGAADHVVAGDPETKAKLRDSDEPTVPVRLVVGAMTGAAVVVVMLRLTFAALERPRAFVAVTTKFEFPGFVGVPEMTPVDVFNDSPAGNVPLETEYVKGPVPEAAALNVNATPVVAAGGVKEPNVGAIMAITDI